MKVSGMKALLGVIVLALTMQMAQAISMNPFKRAGRTRAHTLLVTANFLEPRLLAELAQYRTKQPILLLSPDGHGKHVIYFMPAGTKPMVETVENFKGLIDLINPQRVVILGNASFVPTEFVEQAQKKYPTIVLSNHSWDRNAVSLADLLKQPGLPKTFADYLGRLKTAQNAAKDVD